MKNKICVLLMLLAGQLSGQNKKPEDYGFRHLQMVFRTGTVDILIKSEKGEENVRKPLFLFCQGSLPQPLIKLSAQGVYGVFPFYTDSLVAEYHLAIISKPYIPLIADVRTLNSDMTYRDSTTGRFPAAYSDRNHLDYYVDRNSAVIDYLLKQDFIDHKKLVVAGHSEGSTIAAKLALKNKKVTHLIYASGNPLGRMQSIINQSRTTETDTDSTRYAESNFAYWQQVVMDKDNLDATHGDTYKATYDFSYPPINYLLQLKIPVLVCYGTKDIALPFNDYLRVEAIRQGKNNFTFKAYIGLEHNYFPLTETGQIDYDRFNWDTVADDWRKWAAIK